MMSLVAPVVTAGAAVLVAAAIDVVDIHLSTAEGLQLGGLLVAAMVIDALPIHLEGAPIGDTSLVNVIIIGIAVIFGWGPAALIAFAAHTTVDTVRRRQAITILYNGAVYAAAAAAAGAAAGALERDGLNALIAAVVAAEAAFYVVDVSLVALATARSSRRRARAVLAAAVTSTAHIAVIMASLALVLIILWERSPYVTVLLLGPLATVALYQRSAANSYKAMRLALTDPLTGLGNHRSFRETMVQQLEHARTHNRSLAVCLLDIDDFKQFNDTSGHPAGDRVLVFVAQQLRRGGEAFRIGGDEFALVLADHDADGAAAVAAAVADRIRSQTPPATRAIQMSIGIAVFPDHALDVDSLVQAADSALYSDKERGKAPALSAIKDTTVIPVLRRLGERWGRSARLDAAATVAAAVDMRDAATGKRSWRVAEFAAGIAEAVGLDGDEVEFVRIAGGVHDLGKLAIPEAILRKAQTLTDAERHIVEQHAQIGFRILDTLQIEPIAHWVLHHHERWDGRGYPDGLAGETIPLGARILSVADSFDAMTSNRAYRVGMTLAEATAELERCAGSQFDPAIVEALLQRLSEFEGGPAWPRV